MLHEPIPADHWPTLSDAELSAVIDQAHNHHHVRVTAYLGNELAAQRALDFGVDEWAHMPCDSAVERSDRAGRETGSGD